MHHLDEFSKKTKLQQEYTDNAYMLWILGLYLDESDLDDLANRSLTDGGNDKCMDFMEIDKTGQKIVIAQGYYARKTSDKAPSKKASDMNTAVAWLAHGDNKSKTINEKVRTRIEECRKAIANNEIEQIDLLYIHNLPESQNTQEEITTCQNTANELFKQKEIQVTFKEIGLKEAEALFRERSSQIIVKDSIPIDGDKNGAHSTPDWDAYMFTIKGSWLRNLFKTHDDKLFSANYRGFLGINKRKAINSVIRSTAEKKPEDFWVFNNGITLLTNGIKEEGKTTYLEGLSIINGAQTTGSLGNTDPSIDLSNVKVMCRVVVCKNPAKIDEIVKYNNTQNKITTWDQYANDELQLTIRKQFKEIGYDYSVKRGFESSDAAIGIEKVAQSILAFNGFYLDANRGKNSIFDRPEIYKRAFTDRSARHILLAYCFSKSIDATRKTLSQKVRTDNEDAQLQLFNSLNFKYFLLSCIGSTLQPFLGRKAIPSEAKISTRKYNTPIQNIVETLETMTRRVLRATHKELTTLSKSTNTPVTTLITEEGTLGKIEKDMNMFIETVIDGNPEQAHIELISIES